ncbi:paraquat-inducible protein A [Rhizobium sp. TH2]|uniref:paraquat-inducible protein A n=1 Tax=Rhizobium sp. TH2 TaxID=2775403 RepID=UPI0021586010|nr:paraquat-inducible protein A [Rhizobium sp. TH2]UVC07300.1 paraquat-inducible protein A [Rhizobium sp. TH2]
MRIVLPVLFVLAPFLFAFGITLPLMTFEKLFFFEENPSLTGIIWSLYDNGDYALALVVALFSIAFPFAKMVAITAEALAAPGEASGWFAKFVPFLTKWSMMDVMLVAIVIAAAKTSGLANAFTEAGLWCYAGSALMTTVIQWLVARRARASVHRA